MKFKGLIIGLLVACFSIPAFAQQETPTVTTTDSTIVAVPDSSEITRPIPAVELTKVVVKTRINWDIREALRDEQYKADRDELIIFINADPDPSYNTILIQAAKQTPDITFKLFGGAIRQE